MLKLRINRGAVRTVRTSHITKLMHRYLYGHWTTWIFCSKETVPHDENVINCTNEGNKIGEMINKPQYSSGEAYIFKIHLLWKIKKFHNSFFYGQPCKLRSFAFRQDFLIIKI
jgi:hypothetical protein